MTTPAPARDHVATVVGWCLAIATAMLLPATPAGAHPATDPVSYAWVSPPPGVATSGPPAQGRRVTLDTDLLGQGRADVWTPDLQALVTIEGSAPVTVQLDPRDPGALPPLPGLAASGNAYEVRVDGDVQEAVVLLRPPHQVDTMARWDGTDWTLTTVSPGPNGEVWASLPTGTATYVAAAPRLDGHTSAVAAFVHDPLRVAVATAGLVAGVIGVQRLRRTRR